MNPEKPNLDQAPSSQEQGERVRSKKGIAWDKKLVEVNEIADRLGKGVDEKIKEAVAAFLMHEFTTSASCEGHSQEADQEEHGLPYPWVEIYAPEPAGWEGDKEIQAAWTIENLQQQKKLIALLEEFYQKRETSLATRLTPEKIGAYGGFRIQSLGAELWPLLHPKERQEKLELYRAELNDFTKFLKDKYFAEETAP